MGYCGRIRTTKDTDIVSHTHEQGYLIKLLKECGYSVTRTSFGLSARRLRGETSDVLHISVGEIIDESRGFNRRVSYAVSQDSYEEGPKLPLLGIAK